ncbi:TPA: hypothetical protein ACX6Q3_003186 [Photobacterium damselae]
MDYNKITSISMYDSLYSIFVRVFFKNYLYSFVENKGSTVTFFNTTYSYGRSDYDEMVEFIKSIMMELGIKHTIVDVSEVKSFKGVIFKLYLFIKFFISYLIKNKVNLKKILLRVKIEYERKKLQDIIIKLNSRSVFTFCDAHFIDSLITQISRTKKIKTYTLQHGQYEIKSNVDCPENYALINLESDFLLAWGDATVDEYHNNVKGNCSIVPLGLCTNNYDKQDFLVLKEIKKVKIYLNSDKDYLSNLKMLNIIVDFCDRNLLYYEVFYHPMSDKKLYNVKLKVGISPKVEKYNEINIILSSGVIVKKMAFGENIVLFYEGKNIFSPHFYSFSNDNDIITVFDSIKNNPEIYRDTLIKSRDYFLEKNDSYSNYKKFFINEFIINAR